MKHARIALLFALVPWIFPTLASGQEAAPADIGLSLVKIEGPLDVSMLSHLRRAFDQARQADEALVIELDTPGGEVELMWQMANAIAEASEDGLSTIGWVHDRAHSAGALVALACERLYMRPHASMGAALPVSVGVGGLAPASQDEEVREKISATLRSEFRGIAERMGRSGVLAEAMVDPSLTVREVLVDGERRFVSDKGWDELQVGDESVRYESTVCYDGELLAVTGSEALRYGLIDGLAETVEELAEKAVGRRGVPREIVRTKSEDLAGLLYGLMPVLFLAGVILAFVEFKVPGFGVPGILSILCFAVLLGGRYLVGLADVPHLVLLVVGSFLIAVELFLLPGSIWAGLLGGVSLLAGLVWSVLSAGAGLEYDLGRQIVVDQAFQLVLAALASMVGMWLVSRFLPRTPLLQRLVLEGTGEPRAHGAAMPDSARAARAEVGAKGVALTDLRPVGKVVLAQQAEVEFEALAEGDEIPSGEQVRVVEVRSSGRLVVAREARETTERA